MASAVVVILTAVVVLVLWWPATKGLTGNELVAARFDALRIGLSIGVGSGGVIVLYLTWRRQRAMEDTLAHQERVAESTEDDARERRITDLYTKAADQLGSQHAAVRLAGLYALERLAQDHPKQRQTVVNVLCAYLRMPFELPAEPPTPPIDSSGVDDRAHQHYRELLSDHRERVQEREVRHTAQRILSFHSRPGHSDEDDDTYWPGLELDFTGATLDAPDFGGCHIGTLSLKRAQIGGFARFDEAQIKGAAWLGGALFEEIAWFFEAQFEERADFAGAQFKGEARFTGSQFARDVEFGGAQFNGTAWFNGIQVEGLAWFRKAQFEDGADFAEARFDGAAGFSEAQFKGDAWFTEAQFKEEAEFGGAQFGGAAWFTEVRFEDGVGFGKTRFEAEARFTRVQVDVVTTDGAIFAYGIPSELSAAQRSGDS